MDFHVVISLIAFLIWLSIALIWRQQRKRLLERKEYFERLSESRRLSKLTLTNKEIREKESLKYSRISGDQFVYNGFGCFLLVIGFILFTREMFIASKPSVENAGAGQGA